MKVLLAFRDAESNIRRKLLKRGFGHVAVLIPQGDKTLKIEGVKSRLSAYIIDAYVDLVAANYSSTHQIVTYDAVFEDKIPVSLRFGILNCVSVACYSLGITSRIWTPHGLYKYLINRGAKPWVDHQIQAQQMMQQQHSKNNLIS